MSAEIGPEALSALAASGFCVALTHGFRAVKKRVTVFFCKAIFHFAY